jgi:hypothetical protein
MPSNATPPAAIIDQGEGSGTGATLSAFGRWEHGKKMSKLQTPSVCNYKEYLRGKQVLEAGRSIS